MLCYRRLTDDDPYSVILRVPRVESRLFPGPASLFARILRNWATKYISPGYPSIAHNGFGGTNPWGESIIATPRGWNPHGHYLPHNAGPTQALNLADLGNGVPGPHGAGNVRLPQLQRKPGRAGRRGPAVPAASVSNWASASSSKRS